MDGGADDFFSYLIGDWSVEKYGVQAMPYDGLLLASRVTVAKEAHTSMSVKDLIVAAQGVHDNALARGRPRMAPQLARGRARMAAQIARGRACMAAQIACGRARMAAQIAHGRARMAAKIARGRARR